MNTGRQAPTQPQTYGVVQDPQRILQSNFPYGVFNFLTKIIKIKKRLALNLENLCFKRFDI